MEQKTKLPWYKNKRNWIVIGAVLLGLILGDWLGSSTVAMQLEEEKVTYDELVAIISEKETELEELENKISQLSSERDSLQKEVDSNKEILADIEEYKANKEEAEQLEEKISELNNQISEKEEELATLTGKIRETGEKPIELPAGKFIVGHDLPEGRYKILPIGRGSNFAAYNESGELVDNAIISSREGHGVPELVTFLFDGYIIEARSPFKYVPIE